MTAKELCKTDQATIEIESVPGLKLGVPSVMVIASPAGLGKSTAAALIGAENRPCIYFSFEESLSQTIAERLRRCELRHDDLWIEVPSSMQGAYDIIERRDPRSLIVDSLSVCAFTIRDLCAIAESRRCIVIGVVHENKAGAVGGDSLIEYGADVVLRFTEVGKWKLTKSRFQPLTEGSIPTLCPLPVESGESATPKDASSV